MNQACRAIKALAPAFQLHVKRDAAGCSELQRRVVATNVSVPVTSQDLRPNVDLIFYEQNITHVWIEPTSVSWYLVWRRETVFPLYLRPLDRYWLSAPCNTLTYLISEYGPQLMVRCKSPAMNHRKDNLQRRTSVYHAGI